MIGYILNRTVWRNWSKETQDILCHFMKGPTIIHVACDAVWYFIFLFTQVPCFITYIGQRNELKTGTGVALICYSVISLAIYIFAHIKLAWPLYRFSDALAERAIYLAYTKRGQALSVDDLKTILDKNNSLFAHIATGKCRGYCYYISFSICKALEKGSLEFVAIKDFVRVGETPANEYTMHVAYVQNGWAFDTYSARQFPLEKFHEIQKAKVCKTFTFEEIKCKTYEQFEAETGAEICAWAAKSDCSIDWGPKKVKK